MSNLKEINKRRTFGIIAHPDAGKTLSEARKLIQLNFKTYLDKQILPTTNKEEKN